MGPFATATEFCEFTGIGMPDDLARLQSHLDLASGIIRRYCSQVLSVVTDDTFQITTEQDTDKIILPERPVTAIDSVEVDAVAQTYTFTRSGVVTNSVTWPKGTTIEVTYTHGYAESDPEFVTLRSVCIDSASRSFTMNERSASEAMGSTLMESAGYSPETFLTTGEKMALADFGKVGVG